MKIEQLTPEKVDCAAHLAAEFRVTLKHYKGISAQSDIASGRAELLEYLGAGFPVFWARENGTCLGYLVCRVDAPCVWVEALYICPEFRRQGVASALYAKAEELAESYGEETVYNYVHPNNDGIIAFLRKRGYTVLNLVELRKPYANERLTTKIRVNDNTFDY